MIRDRICIECGHVFSYEIKRGSDRHLCSDFCRTKRRHAKALQRPMCVMAGCRNLRGGHRSGLCDSCETRLRRTGTLAKRVWKYRSMTSHGYVRVQDKTHELAGKHGGIYEHRKVLFDAIGHGPHQCYWCQAPISWVVGRCIKGALVPDHLDGDKSNNALSNLVAACNRCNATRGLFMAWVREHQDDPWLWRMFNETVTHRGVGKC